MLNRFNDLIICNFVWNKQCNIAGDFLADIKLFDLYQGEKIDDGFKSLAYTLVYRNSEGTLSDDEINQAFDKVVKKLQEELEVTVR